VEVKEPSLEQPRDVLRIQVDQLPRFLNPLVTHDRWCWRIAMYNIFEPLVVEKNSGGFRPHLAASYSFHNRGRTLRIVLRPNIRFHDGEELSAADVKYTLQSLRNKYSPSSLLRLELEDIKEVRATDSRTVEISLHRTNRLVLGVLAEIPILPAHLYARRGLRNGRLNSMPVGTGPFQVQERNNTTSLILVRNEDYWGQKARIRELQLRAIPDPALALAALRNNELEMIYRLYPGYYPKQLMAPRLKQRYRALRIHPYRMRLMIFNVRRSPFSDKRVRTAVIRLTDRQKMVREIRNGLGQPLSAPLWPLGSWNNRTIHPRALSRSRAARLLDMAGWQVKRGRKQRYRVGWPLKISILRAVESKEMRQAAQILKQELNKAGFGVEIRAGDFGFVTSQLKRGKFDIALMGLAPRAQADLAPYFQTKGRLNYSGYQNEAVDEFLRSMRVSSSPASRVTYARRLHRMLHDDPPVAVLYAPIEVMVVSRRIRGLANNGRWPKLVSLSMGPELEEK